MAKRRVGNQIALISLLASGVPQPVGKLSMRATTLF